MIRKALAIITILALVVGFAFAANSHPDALSLQMIVYSVKPIIELRYTNSNYVGTDGSLVEKMDLSGIGSDNTIDIGFSISDGGRVTFQALLNNYTRTNERYSLVFGGGTFSDVVRRGTIGTRSPNSITTGVGTADVEGIGSITLGEPAGTGGEGNKKVVVQFDGALDSKATLPLALASAEYEYPEDKTIDSGTYYADVTLTVTAEQ